MRKHGAGKQWPNIAISKHRKGAARSVAQRQKRKTRVHEPGEGGRPCRASDQLWKLLSLQWQE